MILHSAKYHNFPYAGYVSGGSLNGVGSSLARGPEVGPVDAGGDYWSRTAKSANTTYRLNFDSSNIYSAASNYRYYGYSIRCVATT